MNSKRHRTSEGREELMRYLIEASNEQMNSIVGFADLLVEAAGSSPKTLPFLESFYNSIQGLEFHR